MNQNQIATMQNPEFQKKMDIIRNAGISVDELGMILSVLSPTVYKVDTETEIEDDEFDYLEKYTFHINPNSKPTMTKKDVWLRPSRPCVRRYWDFADEMRSQVKKMGYQVGEILSVDFIVQMPKSWSKKKKALMDGKKHQQKPDLSNFMKAFEDVLCKDDSFIWSYKNCNKFWGTTGKIIVTD